MMENKSPDFGRFKQMIELISSSGMGIPGMSCTLVILVIVRIKM